MERYDPEGAVAFELLAPAVAQRRDRTRSVLEHGNVARGASVIKGTSRSPRR